MKRERVSMSGFQHQMNFRNVTVLSCALALVLCSVAVAQNTINLPTPFHFDGSTFIVPANSQALSPTAQITIEAWIKPDFSAMNFVDTIVEKRDGCSSSRSYDFGVYKFPERLGQIFFSPSMAGDDMYSPLGIFPEDGQFHHVAATYDGATEKIFLDGVVVASQAHSGAIPTTSSPPIVGTDRCSHPAFADMYGFKLFDHALSDQEVMNDAGDFGILSDGVSALLSGNNTFSGNQTINGTVMATSFSGDGSALLNLSPANLSTGTAGINITGTASAAVSATNAANLGGVPADNYARLGVDNTFTGNQSVTGNVSASGNLAAAGTTTLGTGGTPIVGHLSTTFNPTFAALKASTCVTANFTLTGASDGDTLALGVANARTSGGGTIVYFAWVSAANTVTIEGCNISGSPQKTAGSGPIRIDLWKHQ